MDIKDLIAPAQRHATRFSKENNALPGCFVFRREMPSDFEAVVYDPVICLILQGGKTLNAGGTTVSMTAGDALLVSHDMPVSSRITKASRVSPYLALILSLDISILRSLYELVGVQDTRSSVPALSPFRASQDLVDPMSRYLALADDSLAAEVLGPSVLREIHFRLLISPAGGMLRNLLSVGSHASRIAKAIRAIRQDFRAPLSISHLASLAGMSTSSFHEHFKAVTGTSPLQYQKDLRMIEARRLLAEGRVSVSSASFEVGYESATQFSREFSRKFGTPPSRIAEIALRTF
jgi:AraC-like DNA-binding protein/uncharacterized cupin superfamily protein